jgi:hypothetical protein
MVQYPLLDGCKADHIPRSPGTFPLATSSLRSVNKGLKSACHRQGSIHLERSWIGVSPVLSVMAPHRLGRESSWNVQCWLWVELGALAALSGLSLMVEILILLEVGSGR